MTVTAFLLVCSLFTSAPQQHLIPAGSPIVVVLIGDTLPKLEEVNNAAADIDSKISSYKIEEKDVSDEIENVLVTGYYDKKELRKITVEHSSSAGKMWLDYYFNKNGLFYVQRNVVLYGMDANTQDTAVAGVASERYYFYKGKMFAWINAEKKPMSTGAKRFRKAEEMVMSELEFGKQALQKQ